MLYRGQIVKLLDNCSLNLKGVPIEVIEVFVESGKTWITTKLPSGNSTTGLLGKYEVVQHTVESYFQLLCKTSREGKFPAVRGDTCAYRNGNGRACAFGILIPDDRYDSLFERKSLFNLVSHFPSVRDFFPIGMSLNDLNYVQQLHDSTALHTSKWDHERFVRDLQSFTCFKDFKEEHDVSTPLVTSTP